MNMRKSSTTFLMIVILSYGIAALLQHSFDEQQRHLTSLVFAAKVNAPFITAYPNDITGKDVLKVNLEITGLHNKKGLIETCIYTELPTIEQQQSKICNISNMTKDYQHYFPANNCPTCIVPIGTVVFPHGDILEGTKITACVRDINTQITKCNYTLNHTDPINEQIIISLK